MVDLRLLAAAALVAIVAGGAAVGVALVIIFKKGMENENYS